MSAPGADGLEPQRLTARFFHLEKLPVAQRSGLTRSDFDEISAALSGSDLEMLDRFRDEFDDALDGAADALLAEAAVREQLGRLPLSHGDTIVALGDSITDDALSWANQLTLVLERGRPDLDVRVVNAGYTGDTTQEAISRLDLILGHSPAWVIQLLGTNDARRHGTSAVRTTSLHETRRNIRVLRRVLADAGVRHLVMTPPPVDSARSDAWSPFHDERIGWRGRDLRRIRDVIAETGPHLDLHTAFEAAADPHLLLADGVHPTLDGQSFILRHVLRRLSSEPLNATTEPIPHPMTERSHT